MYTLCKNSFQFTIFRFFKYNNYIDNSYNCTISFKYYIYPLWIIIFFVFFKNCIFYKNIKPWWFSIFVGSVSDNHRNSCIMQTRVIANIYNRTVFVDALLIFFSIYLVKNSNFSHVTSGYFSYIFLWYYIIICYKKNIPLESPSTSIF